MINDALYIHIPFCIRKCAYCDFLSFQYSEVEMEKYVDFLIKEISLYENYKFNTVYFGGGTPSLLKKIQIEKILSKLNIEKNTEITLEANPKTLNYESLLNLKKAGINRLSIGVQSFDDNILKNLSRLHNSKEAINIYNEARKAGFSNISLDLMFAVPGQNMQILKKDLKILKELSPEHISIYSLIWEENTLFWEMREQGKIFELSEDEEAKMYEEIINFLKNNNYIHYEISNFSKKGFESKHNTKYWENKNYLGIGLGAALYIENKRYKNLKNLQEYYSKIQNKEKPIEEIENIDLDLEEEYRIILGLRLLEKGIKFKRDIDKRKAEILLKEGLLIFKNDKYFLSKKGLFLGNNVFSEFLG